MARPFIGIDFGTSNSTIGVADFLGRAARRAGGRADDAAERAVLSLRRARCCAVWPCRAADADVGGEHGPAAARAEKHPRHVADEREDPIGRRAISFAEVLRAFFRFSSRQRGGPFGAATSTGPCSGVRCASSTTTMRRRRREASVLWKPWRATRPARIAFQYEPIAAALDYEQRVAARRSALSSTSAAAPRISHRARLSDARAPKTDRKDDVLANAGVHVGGTDFDRWLSLTRCHAAGSATAPGRRTASASCRRAITTTSRRGNSSTGSIRARTMSELKQIRSRGRTARSRRQAHPDRWRSGAAIRSPSRSRARRSS